MCHAPPVPCVRSVTHATQGSARLGQCKDEGKWTLRVHFPNILAELLALPYLGTACTEMLLRAARRLGMVAGGCGGAAVGVAALVVLEPPPPTDSEVRDTALNVAQS